MATETNVTIEETVENVENVTTNEEMTYEKIIRKVLAEGATRKNNIRIKNVNYDEKDNYTRVSFTLATKVPGYVSEDNGNTWKLGLTNVIFTSLYAIVGAIKEDENLGWMANTLLENPKALNPILNGANIDIIQQEVEHGKPYINPFSSSKTPTTFDNDNVVNHVVKFKLSDTGKRMADMLAMKSMGF